MYPHPPSLRSLPLSGKEVVKCYRHATAARERAKQVNDPAIPDRERATMAIAGPWGRIHWAAERNRGLDR